MVGEELNRRIHWAPFPAFADLGQIGARAYERRVITVSPHAVLELGAQAPEVVAGLEDARESRAPGSNVPVDVRLSVMSRHAGSLVGTRAGSA